MKKILTLLIVLLAMTNSYAIVSNYTANNPEVKNQIQELGAEFENLALDDFLNMTPKKYREITGERLGIKNAVKLKAAQKFLKKQQRKAGGSDISEGVYILLAILGLGWLAMGLIDDWDGNNWIIGLVLSLLCWLPGVIYSLVKKDEYF